jgi:hypothetical protein
MRGTAQAKDLNPEAVDRLFEHVSFISTITPTGGEPSLNPDALDTIKIAAGKYKVDISGVYIVTNGKQISDHFVNSLMNLMLITDADEYNTGIALSSDMFHDPIPTENIRKLKLFSCFDMDAKKTDWHKIPPIARGRAKHLSSVRTQNRNYTNSFYDAEIDDERKIINLPECQLSLTVDGDLVSDCDYSYSDVKRITICNVFEDDWMDTFMRKTRKAIAEQE